MFRSRLSLFKSSSVLPKRLCAQDKPALQSSLQEKKDSSLSRRSDFSLLDVKIWVEERALRRLRKDSSPLANIKCITDLLKYVQNWNNFPTSFTDLNCYLIRRNLRIQLAEQKYLAERVIILKPDLAAAHFILYKGGRVKFVGDPDWYGVREKKNAVPITFLPGKYLEAIDAEGATLYYEGLENFTNLKYLTYLSFKNLETFNDWCLDAISKNHHSTLKHLNISGCKNVTYRGFSCFYRFECLETLEVENISDAAEFKLACLMLYDIFPDLEIKGIDLNIPPKIDGVEEQSIVKS